MNNNELTNTLLQNRFACNVNKDGTVSYFGSYPKVYSCADHPKKPTKRLVKFLKSLNYHPYLYKEHNFFWNKDFWLIKINLNADVSGVVSQEAHNLPDESLTSVRF